MPFMTARSLPSCIISFGMLFLCNEPHFSAAANVEFTKPHRRIWGEFRSRRAACGDGRRHGSATLRQPAKLAQHAIPTKFSFGGLCLLISLARLGKPDIGSKKFFALSFSSQRV